MAEYLFNGGFEETVERDDGVAEGGPVFATDRFGQASSALALDGIDDRVTAARAKFTDGDSISISLWLRVPPPQVSYVIVLTNGQFKVVTPNDEQVGAIFLTTCDQLRNVCGAYGKMSRGIWHHVLATYDGVNTSIYIDGNLANQLLLSSALLGSGQPLTFGFSDPFGHGQKIFWSGTLDDVRIYDRAISEEVEVSDLYHERGYGM